VYEALHIGFGVLVLGTLLLVPPRWAGLRRRPRDPEVAQEAPATA
jgi:hypothetical protein